MNNVNRRSVSLIRGLGRGWAEEVAGDVSRVGSGGGILVGVRSLR